jgi:hypothetical protein
MFSIPSTLNRNLCSRPSVARHFESRLLFHHLVVASHDEEGGCPLTSRQFSSSLVPISRDVLNALRFKQFAATAHLAN